MLSEKVLTPAPAHTHTPQSVPWASSLGLERTPQLFSNDESSMGVGWTVTKHELVGTVVMLLYERTEFMIK